MQWSDTHVTDNSCLFDAVMLWEFIFRSTFFENQRLLFFWSTNTNSSKKKYRNNK